MTPQVLIVDAATGEHVDSLTDPILETVSYAPSQ